MVTVDEIVPEHLGIALGRAAAGALIFGIPMLMTMEMWGLGFYMDRLKLLLLLTISLPFLTGLSYYSGFEPTFRWWEDLRDALVAIAVGAIISASALWLFGVLDAGLSWNEMVGKITLQTVPACIGALLARSQFGEKGGKPQEERHRPGQGYGAQLFLMSVGALFLAWNVAPTEEVVLIAYKIAPGRELALLAASLVVMHGFVYATNFAGSPSPHPAETFWSLFLRYTVAGYAVVLLVSLYVLWTFGRIDGASVEEILSTMVVLSFPGAIGAAAARLLL